MSDTIDQIIANAQNKANEQLTRMNSKTDEAVNIAQTQFLNIDFPDGISPDTPETLTLEPPTLTLQDLIDLEDPKSLKIKEDIDREFEDFLDTYFPDFTDLSSEVVDWIKDQIQQGGQALPGDEEGKIWDRARAREDTLNQKNTHEAVEAMARRGWSAPPGVLTERLRVAQAENILRQSTLSRDIAIEQAKLALDTLKFAVSQAVAVQQNALSAASQFVSEYVRASAIGLDSSAALANSAVSLYNQTVAYYRAFFEQEGLKLRFATADADQAFRSEVEDLEGRKQRVENASKTAIEAARALGDSAAAALGAQNTMAATVEEIVNDGE